MTIIRECETRLFHSVSREQARRFNGRLASTSRLVECIVVLIMNIID